MANADLRNAILFGANLTDANLSGAVYNEDTLFPSGSDIYSGI